MDYMTICVVIVSSCCDSLVQVSMCRADANCNTYYNKQFALMKCTIH